MATHNVYLNPRPTLTIKVTGGRKLGNCYSATYYEVTSRTRLTRDQLEALFEAGFLGCGQEFRVDAQCDGEEPSAGEDLVECVTEVDGVPQPGPALNPYSGKPYEPMKQPYYTYRTETRCDSSD
jgi:hypothetical protein